MDSGQLLLLAVPVLFVVWMLSRGRRQQRETETMQASVRPGAEVMTTSGLHGTVVEVEDGGTIRLEISPGVVARWDRRAVARILSTPDLPAAGTPAVTLPDEPAAVVAEPEPAEPGATGARPGPDVAPPDRS